ncbi:PepSY domain-containing protein [Kitasatospora setae]|uniref:PepSY domain-containing protein n=1 Tax=Kitasatospora setae TaxID=2066 RepID=UPI0002F8E81A|nr:PepSY domain-containing protein [Kitasatospora setae]
MAEQVPVARPALRLPGRRGVRWVIGIAAVVVLGAVAVGAGAALERHHEREVVAFDRGYAEKRGAVFAPGVPDAPKVPGAPGQLVIRDGDGSVRSLPLGGRVGGIGPDSVNGRGGVAPGWSLAPAALPAVPADQALAKAVAAVPNGKAAALTVVNREGGGSSWSVEVLGADGVRHLVTVDGTDGSVTGNTTTDGR